MIDFSILNTKTFWSAVVTIVTAVAMAVGVEVPPGTVEALLALTAIFMRLGIKKAEN